MKYAEKRKEERLSRILLEPTRLVRARSRFGKETLDHKKHLLHIMKRKKDKLVTRDAESVIVDAREQANAEKKGIGTV